MMQVERPFGDKNKTILCNAPPLLPGSLLNEAVVLQASRGIKPQYGDFSIASFLARYLAGNRSLKEARQVSRKRLALVGSSVGYLDAEAYELHLQIQRYQKAKKALVDSPAHTIDSICRLNGLIAPEKKGSGQLRRGQNWVGGKTPFTARYICPPPEFVPKLMDNWLTFTHSADYSPETKAIIGHCRLVTIHPFIEGNGRTARLFLDGMLEKTYGDRVPLLTYRLSPACQAKGYVEALELLDAGDAAGFTHSFWREAIDWCDKQQVKIVTILDDTKKQINSKIGLRMLSAASVRLLNHIWSQPVVCQKGLLKLFDMDITRVSVAVNELVNSGILQPRKLREPANAVIYDCPLIFAAYKAIDDGLFEVADKAG